MWCSVNFLVEEHLAANKKRKQENNFEAMMNSKSNLSHTREARVCLLWWKVIQVGIRERELSLFIFSLTFMLFALFLRFRQLGKFNIKWKQRKKGENFFFYFIYLYFWHWAHLLQWTIWNASTTCSKPLSGVLQPKRMGKIFHWKIIYASCFSVSARAAPLHHPSFIRFFRFIFEEFFIMSYLIKFAWCY